MHDYVEVFKCKKLTIRVVLPPHHPRKIVGFCETCFWHNLRTNDVKYIKVYIFRKDNSQGIYLNRQIFGLKSYFWEIAKKSDFLAQICFNKGKKIFLDKITKNLPKPSKYVYLGIFFSLFVLLISHFGKILTKKAKKSLFGQNFSFFGPKNPKFSKIRN